MNQSLFLHIVERLEALVGKLPGAIQKPILHELTPMKELFLQQRSPRFLFSGSNTRPVLEILQMLFPEMIEEHITVVSSVNRWHDAAVLDRGTISILDARSLEDSSAEVEIELKRQPADVIFFIDENDGTKKAQKSAMENLSTCLAANEKWNPNAKIVGLVDGNGKSGRSKAGASANGKAELKEVLASHGDRLTGTFHLSGPGAGRQTTEMMSIIARELPNAARIEMARISQDRVVQADIAQILVKSTTAMCTAIGAQPIPLADLPILTTLQLMMVSGIMYVGGRERSLRAATEFVGALGANVGAGMLLREGTRAVLKFFPGWGNLICGMVAGAGTYAIGRAAIVYFLEGVSLKDARRTYLSARKKSARPGLVEEKPVTGPGKAH
jgi:uncharacterized protein (DUF697 family)